MAGIIKGQIIAPVGSGKTRIEYEAVSDCLKMGAEIILVVAPRIALIHQIINEFYSFKQENFDTLCVCSSQAEIKEWYQGEELEKLSVKTTTNPMEIKESILKSNKIVIFSTLHSCNKIKDVLNEIDKISDLVIFDEAHNLINEEWFNFVKEDFPTKRQLFFTATRKVSIENGKGMNNEKYFGKIIHQVDPLELIKQNIIVAPRMHILKQPENIIINEKDDIKKEVAIIISAAKKHLEIMENKEARLIIFCENASQAHDLAESQTLKDFLPDWNIEAITSLTHRKNRNRKDVFEDFLKSKKSILFHYDIVSEGVDLPGATGILPLRFLGNIKIIQAIGRVLRLNSEDKKRLLNKDVLMEDKNNWIKPYGWIILPVISEDFAINKEIISFFVKNLRSSGFNFDVEEMCYIEEPEGCELSKSVFDNGDEKYKKIKIFKGNENIIEEIEKNVIHIIEQEKDMFYEYDDEDEGRIF